MLKALLIPFFFLLKRSDIIDSFTYEEYLNAIELKEETRKQLLEIRVQIELNKFNQQMLKILEPKEQELRTILKRCIFIIKSYEIENEIERGKEHDKHKGK